MIKQYMYMTISGSHSTADVGTAHQELLEEYCVSTMIQLSFSAYPEPNKVDVLGGCNPRSLGDLVAESSSTSCVTRSVGTLMDNRYVPSASCPQSVVSTEQRSLAARLWVTPKFSACSYR